MTALGPPPIHFGGRWWTADELSAIATAWWGVASAQLRPTDPGVGMVMSNHPEAVALFFALSALPAPVVLLADDPRTWRSSPPLPAGMPIVLPPAWRRFSSEAEAVGCRALHLAEPRLAGSPSPGPAPFVTGPGAIAFTSGSTGLPKPVYRSRSSLLGHAAVVVEILGLTRGSGVIGSLPLSGFHGLANTLLTATLLGAPLGLMPRFDHRTALRFFASGAYGYWAATPLMADLLTRCPLDGPPPAAPPVVKISGGRLPQPLFMGFRARFGVPLRPAYGSSEAGIISADTAPPERVRYDTVGRPVPGVAVRIGDDPRNAATPGTPGRIWLAMGHYMEGYGFPPRLELREERGGWWPTRDLGVLDEDGYLTLVGRMDDCFKTPTGQLVNPEDVAAAFRRHPGVGEAAVVPLCRAGGSAVGAVVEARTTLDPLELRRHVARFLATWAQPEAVVVVPELPRLGNGKVDRAACAALIEPTARSAAGPASTVAPG